MVHSTAAERWKQRPTRGGRPAGNNSKNKGGWKKTAPKEITFDDEARREYLTGFSKRKKEKKDAARERALVREKEEAKQLRQQLRKTRREQAANNVQIANDFYGGAPMIDATQVDFDVDMDKEVDLEEQEYSNDEMTTRVVIEDFRLSDDEDDKADEDKIQADARQRAWSKRRDHDVEIGEYSDDEPGPSGRQMDDRDRGVNIFGILPRSKPNPATSTSIPSTSTGKARASADSFATPNDTPDKKKKPAKRFTYETKAARRAESLKQKMRRKERADSSRSGKAGKTGRGMKSPSKKGGKRR